MSKQSGLAVGAEMSSKPHSANCIGKDKYYTMHLCLQRRIMEPNKP